MRTSIIPVILLASCTATSAWAGHGGGGAMRGGGAMGNHGALVSQTAHTAHSSGMKVGPQMRAVARSNGHASASSARNHGQLVSQTAHDARTSGMKVGPQVRTVARSKSRGAAHANRHATVSVNKHSKAAGNSVLSKSG